MPYRRWSANAENLLELFAEILRLVVKVRVAHYVLETFDRLGLRGPAPRKRAALEGNFVDDLDSLGRVEPVQPEVAGVGVGSFFALNKRTPGNDNRTYPHPFHRRT